MPFGSTDVEEESTANSILITLVLPLGYVLEVDLQKKVTWHNGTFA